MFEEKDDDEGANAYALPFTTLTFLTEYRNSDEFLEFVNGVETVAFAKAGTDERLGRRCSSGTTAKNFQDSQAGS